MRKPLFRKVKEKEANLDYSPLSAADRQIHFFWLGIFHGCRIIVKNQGVSYKKRDKKENKNN